jgi:hypothetical protein
MDFRGDILMDYIGCIGTYFPNVIADCIGDPTKYENINWVAGDPLPTKVDMDILIFQNYKDTKITSLSDDCQNAITCGFISNALGSPHLYDSAEVDQLNLIGAVANVSPTIANPTGSSVYYATREVINGVTLPKEYDLHTYDQLRKVMSDGADYKLALLINFNIKRYYVTIATTIEQIDAITWSSNP